MEEVDESTLDEDEKAARDAKLEEIAALKEERRLAREEKEREKAEAEHLKFERREVRRFKRLAKEETKRERQTRRDAGTFSFDALLFKLVTKWFGCSSWVFAGQCRSLHQNLLRRLRSKRKTTLT